MLKSNKGVTLTSLIIYIIVLVIVIGIMNIFSEYFYQNLDEIVIEDNAREQYLNFLAYLTRDFNSENLQVVKVNNNESTQYIILNFSNGEEHQYIFKNNQIYFLNPDINNLKKIVICRNVEDRLNMFYLHNNILYLNLNIMGENFATELNYNFKT